MTTTTRRQLTGRELELLRRSAAGETAEDIAAQHNVSVSTVKHWRTTIFVKLNVVNITAAVAEALRQGLIS